MPTPYTASNNKFCYIIDFELWVWGIRFYLIDYKMYIVFIDTTSGRPKLTLNQFNQSIYHGYTRFNMRLLAVGTKSTNSSSHIDNGTTILRYRIGFVTNWLLIGACSKPFVQRKWQFIISVECNEIDLTLFSCFNIKLSQKCIGHVMTQKIMKQECWSEILTDQHVINMSENSLTSRLERFLKNEQNGSILSQPCERLLKLDHFNIFLYVDIWFDSSKSLYRFKVPLFN